jgi:hypothetical protein
MVAESVYQHVGGDEIPPEKPVKPKKSAIRFTSAAKDDGSTTEGRTTTTAVPEEPPSQEDLDRYERRVRHYNEYIVKRQKASTMIITAMTDDLRAEFDDEQYFKDPEKLWKAIAENTKELVVEEANYIHLEL